MKKVKKYLRRGDMTSIAKEFSVSRAFVYAVLAGERNNDAILQKAIAVAAQRKESALKLKEDLKKL